MSVTALRKKIKEAFYEKMWFWFSFEVIEKYFAHNNFLKVNVHTMTRQRIPNNQIKGNSSEGLVWSR